MNRCCFFLIFYQRTFERFLCHFHSKKKKQKQLLLEWIPEQWRFRMTFFTAPPKKNGYALYCIEQPKPLNGMRKMKNEHEPTKQKQNVICERCFHVWHSHFDFHGLAWKAVWLACHSEMLVISSFADSFIVVNQTRLMSAHLRTCAFEAWISNGFFSSWIFFRLTCECNKHKQNFNVQIKNLSKKWKRFSFLSLYQQLHVYSIKVCNKSHTFVTCMCGYTEWRAALSLFLEFVSRPIMVIDAYHIPNYLFLPENCVAISTNYKYV